MVFVILDIDNTLIHGVNNSQFLYEGYKNKFDSFNIDGNLIIFCRPYLFKFIDELYKIKDIQVGIFTAADESYAKDIIDVLFKNRKLYFVLTRNDYLDCSHKYGNHKDINYVKYRFPQYFSNPFKRDLIPFKRDLNVLIVDDNQLVKNTNKNNCYHIDPFIVLKTYTRPYYRYEIIDIEYNEQAENDMELLKCLDYIKNIN